MQPAENSARSLFSEHAGKRWTGHLLRGILAAALLVTLYFVTAQSAPTTGVPPLLAVLLAATAGLLISLGASGTGLTALAGGFDLSAGGVAGLGIVAGTAVSYQFPDNPWAILGTILLTGVLCGIINGILIVYAHLNPCLLTFITGLLLIQTAEFSPLGYGLLSNNQQIGSGLFELLSVASCALGGLLILIGILKFTLLGRHLRAVGSAPQVARECGINTARVQFTSYLLSSLLASLCAFPIVLFGYWTLPDALSGGLLFPAVAVIGGCAIGGGRGSIFGVLLAGQIAGAGYILSLELAGGYLLTFGLGILMLLAWLLQRPRNNHG